MKRKLFFLLSGFLLVHAVGLYPAMAEQFLVGGRPLNIMGYITQGGAISLNSQDKYDTERGLQSALMNIFLEGDYKLNDNIKFYASGMFTADWIYDLKSSNQSWNDKLFAKSGNAGLYMDNQSWQLLKEANVKWTSSNSMIKLGKQIVSWGETDVFRLMDQINPQDQRRGFADVEFETSIIPIWLLRAEYYLPHKSTWLQDLGFEFVFNPNVQFIRNQGIQTGNDVGGIWAPNAMVDVAPGMQAHIGSADMNINKPGAFNSDGFEYGFKLKGVVAESTVTLNYYYGLDKDPVLKMVGMNSPTVASDGQMILHPRYEGMYPLFRFVGGTFSRDITSLKSDFLGGVSPVLRLETFYAFNNTFGNSLNDFENRNELRWAAGADWKVKIDLLNPRAYFSISPQFYQRKIFDYPSTHTLTGLKEDNYMSTLMISTSYFHNKLNPSLLWVRDWTNEANFFRYQIVYDYSNIWHYTLGVMTFDGNETGAGYELFSNKNQLYFKVSYKFG